jgi:hypothetical protein
VLAEKQNYTFILSLSVPGASERYC